MSNGLPEETFNFLIQANGWSRQSRSVDKKKSWTNHCLQVQTVQRGETIAYFTPGRITGYRFKLSKEVKLLRILLQFYQYLVA